MVSNIPVRLMTMSDIGRTIKKWNLERLRVVIGEMLGKKFCKATFYNSPVYLLKYSLNS